MFESCRAHFRRSRAVVPLGHAAGADSGVTGHPGLLRLPMQFPAGERPLDCG
jgi:hypothetical protein